MGGIFINTAERVPLVGEALEVTLPFPSPNDTFTLEGVVVRQVENAGSSTIRGVGIQWEMMSIQGDRLTAR